MCSRRKLAYGISARITFSQPTVGHEKGHVISRAFTLACVRAKVERFRFHDLRHTFATRLVRAGVDLYAVQKLGRWKTISMVMRYAHHYSESLRPGVEALGRVRSSTELAQGVEMGTVAHA